MGKPAIRDDDEPDPNSVTEMIDRLPSEFRELVCEHYAEEPGVVERLMQLLGMTPVEPIPVPSPREERLRDPFHLSRADCIALKAWWKINRAKALIRWVKKQAKQKEQEEFNDRFLGEGWRERAEQRRKAKETPKIKRRI
jgi:hypothetical protein